MSIRRASILGAIDGIVTSFAIVASAYASNTLISSTTAIGVASLISDAASMGIGEYLSSTAEITRNDKLLSDIKESLEKNKQSVLKEFSEFLATKNVKKSKQIASSFSESPELIATFRGYNNYAYKPLVLGISCFSAFVLFGSIPIMFYILLDSFLFSVISSLLSLFSLGILEIKNNKFFVVEVLFLGTICGLLSYYVAYWIDVE